MVRIPEFSFPEAQKKPDQRVGRKQDVESAAGSTFVLLLPLQEALGIFGLAIKHVLCTGLAAICR